MCALCHSVSSSYHRCLLQVISFFLPFFSFFFLGLFFPPISGHVIRDRHSVNCVCIIVVLCFFTSIFVSGGIPFLCLIAASGLMARYALLVICVTMVPTGENCEGNCRRPRKLLAAQRHVVVNEKVDAEFPSRSCARKKERNGMDCIHRKTERICRKISLSW